MNQQDALKTIRITWADVFMLATILLSITSVAMTASDEISDTLEFQRQHAKKPDVIALCQTMTSQMSSGFKGTSRDIPDMEKCLLEMDPDYAAARLKQKEELRQNESD